MLGGPAMNIGLGGGAASSMASGQSDADLDFASVQRDNPEMERRCQEVIDRCCSWATPTRSSLSTTLAPAAQRYAGARSDGGRGGKFSCAIFQR
ncbi:hypothetical protein MJ563_20545 [Klebsiella pneumoniae]|nr:hypothetical protein MJ563_20545 [Klebsiella pneumoniae]